MNFFYRFTFSSQSNKADDLLLKNSHTRKNPTNGTGIIPDKLSPFALQPSSVPTYINLSCHLPKSLPTRIVIFSIFYFFIFSDE